MSCSAQPPKKVCDQSDLVVPAYDIFEAVSELRAMLKNQACSYD